MRGLNKVTLLGNLGKEPDIQTWEGNVTVAKFSLATTEIYKDDKGQKHTVTDWLTVVLWRGLADLAAKYLQKGSMIYLEGKNTLHLSENTIHSRLNAAKFYFEQVLGRERMFIEIPRPKKKNILPNVLAISQVEKLFANLENLKHKTMLFLAYSAGLRVSEVVHLKVRDIHSERMVINIKGAKGKKTGRFPFHRVFWNFCGNITKPISRQIGYLRDNISPAPTAPKACSKFSIKQKPEQGFYYPLLFIVYGTVIPPTCMNAERI